MTQDELNKILIDFSRLGQLSIVKEAIRQGADVHAVNDLALQLAAKYGRLDVVVVLVENGAYVHAENDLALRWAAYYGHQDIVKYLKSAA